MKRRGIERFFFKGPHLHCPDCGEVTPFQVGSLFGDLRLSPRTKEAVIRRLYADCKTQDILRNLCSACEFDEKQYIFWVDLDGEIRGPLCGRCFYEFVSEQYGGEGGAPEDTLIYYIRINETNQRQMNEIEHLNPADVVTPVRDFSANDLF